MRLLPLLLPLLLLSAGLLVQALPGTSDDPALIRFGAPRLIDDVRAGGEPGIAVTGSTIVVSAHPGFTHLYITEPSTHVPTEVVQDYGGQSYVWRSTDGGATWSQVGLPTLSLGPRSAAPGNPAVRSGAVDRPWLASSGGTLYFMAADLARGGHVVSRSADGGLTWTDGADSGCGGDLVADAAGTVYVGCGSKVAISTDQGAHFTRFGPAGHSGGSLSEPAVDGAGNVWLAWNEGSSRLFLAGSPDHGATWPWVDELTPQVQAALGSASVSMVWPWVSAGSDGRVAVTLYASPVSGSPTGGAPDRPWDVVSVAVFAADSAAPSIAAQVVKALHHQGPICLSGTTCMTGSVRGQPGSDRRMGDFFETTIAPDGSLLVVYSDTTTHPQDVISHPGFVRQVGGPRFVVDGFRPLQG